MTHVNEAQVLLDGNTLDADLAELSDLVYGVRADDAPWTTIRSYISIRQEPSYSL